LRPLRLRIAAHPRRPGGPRRPPGGNGLTGRGTPDHRTAVPRPPSAPAAPSPGEQQRADHGHGRSADHDAVVESVAPRAAVPGPRPVAVAGGALRAARPGPLARLARAL